MSRPLLLALAAALLPAATAMAAPVSLRDLDTPPLAAQGIVATATAFVPVAPGYVVEGGTVDLRFEHSPLLLADRSTVTVLAGGIPLASARLTRRNATGGRLRARLPRLPQARNGFTLEARFSMRLTRDDCEDPRNAALWARVLDTTTVDAELAPARRGLSDALANLAPPGPGEPVDVVLGQDPTPGQLAAAGTAAAAIGRADARIGADPLLELAPAPRDRPAVVVGGGGAADGEAPAAGTGLLTSAQTGPPRIELHGDDRGLARAAEALAASRLTPPTGRRAVIAAAPPRAPARAVAWQEAEASFAQLGIERRELVGQGEATIDLVVDRPPHWRVNGEPSLDLRVVAGAAVREQSSTVTASVAGREIGSQRLRPGGGPQRLRFSLPAGLADTDLDGAAVRSVPVALRFDLDVEQERCVPVDDDDARVALLDTSSLRLPHETTGQRDLSRFPAPMRGRVHVVVPDGATRAETAAGLQAMAAIGRWSAPDARLPRLIGAREAREARGAASLLLVAGADEQVGGRVRASGEPPLGPGEGILVVRESPWAGDQTVLSVRGGDDEGLERAVRALTQRAFVQQLVGTAMVIRAAASPEAVAGGPGRPPLELAPVVEEGLLASLPVWAIPAAVVLVMLLALVLVVARRRWMRPGSA
jgi:hypothetical protein